MFVTLVCVGTTGFIFGPNTIVRYTGKVGPITGTRAHLDTRTSTASSVGDETMSSSISSSAADIKQANKRKSGAVNSDDNKTGVANSGDNKTGVANSDDNKVVPVTSSDQSSRTGQSYSLDNRQSTFGQSITLSTVQSGFDFRLTLDLYLSIVRTVLERACPIEE